MIDISGFADRTFSEAIAQAVARSPTAVFVAVSDRHPARDTLASVVQRGLFLGERLRTNGIGQGDVVAVQLPGWTHWLIAAVAVWHAGAVLLPIVSIYGAAEVGFMLRDADARAIVTPDTWRGADYAAILAATPPVSEPIRHIVVGQAGPTALCWDDMIAPIAIAPAEPATPDDIAMLIYTSGTSAAPKGVYHSHRSLLSELAAVEWSQRDVPAPVVLSPWPPGHIAGALAMLRYLVSAVPLVSMERWQPESAPRLIEQERVTTMSCLPLHLAAILDISERDRLDIGTLAHCPIGAAPVPAALVARCEARGLATYHAYGSTEHPTVSLGAPDDPLDKRLMTEGRLSPGVRVRFVDDAGHDVPPGATGEIATKGPEQFVGYRHTDSNGNAFLPGGWFLTGDVGRLDQDGYLVIVDRKKDIIIRGGENISSREVEDLLLEHPAIVEAAVIGVPHDILGEVVCACLVLLEEATLSLEEIGRYFRERGVARQKTPEVVEIREGFSRNGVGKIIKSRLRLEVAAARQR